MSIVYRTPGPWGPSSVTEDLTPAQVDNNFWELVGQIAAKAIQGVGIANAIVNGNQLTFVLTDHTLLGPYTLPTATFTFKGEWVPNYAYFAGDIITHGGATYIVNVNHTSAATFDPSATDGHGNNLYGLLLQNPALTLPSGGFNGAFLRKVGIVDFVASWQHVFFTDLADIVIVGAAEGDVLKYVHGTWTAASPINAMALGDLSDVSLSSPVNGQVLKFLGAWTNIDNTLNNLSNVLISGASVAYDQYPLTWDNATALWKPIKPAQVIRPSAPTPLNAGAVTIDQTTSDTFVIQPTGNATINTSAVIDGQRLTIVVYTVVTGTSYIISFGSNFTPLGNVDTGTLGGHFFAVNFVGQSGNYREISRGTLGRRSMVALTSTVVDPTVADVYSFIPSSSPTLTANAVYPSHELTIIITTSGTTSYTITFGSGFKSQGTLVTGTVNGKVFVIKFVGDGTNYNEIARTTAM